MVSGIGSTSSLSSLLFSRLDTKSQGYLEKSDFTSAFSQISSTDDSSSVDDLFSTLDSDSDGKITESEFSTSLSKLQEELDSQFNQMRMQGHGGPGGAGGMPPPPPADDEGFTQEELQSQLEEIGSTDSQRSALISTIVDNFEAADSDGDGKVSFTEAMAYDQANPSTSTSNTTTTASSSSNSDSSSDDSASSSSEAAVLRKIMELMHAYGVQGQQDNSSFASLISASA